MKKLMIGLLSLAFFSIGFSNEITNYGVTDFTFESYNPESKDIVSINAKKIDLEGSNITYPVFSDNPLVIKNMNKEMEKFIKKFQGTKNKKYLVSYEIKGSNNLFASILFYIAEVDSKNEVKLYNDAITFNVRNGEKINIDDIFLPGYSRSFNSAIFDKVKQLGVSTINTKKSSFKGLQKNQKFYLEDDSIILFYNEGEATEFGDGQLFIPFILTELIGILR